MTSLYGCSVSFILPSAKMKESKKKLIGKKKRTIGESKKIDKILKMLKEKPRKLKGLLIKD